jgi:hypothetical protein
VTSMPESTQNDDWINDSARDDGEFVDRFLEELRRRQAEEQPPVPESRAGLVLAAIEAIDQFFADTPTEALLLLARWERRDELTRDHIADLVVALYDEDEVSAAVALWERHRCVA